MMVVVVFVGACCYCQEATNSVSERTPRAKGRYDMPQAQLELDREHVAVFLIGCLLSFLFVYPRSVTQIDFRRALKPRDESGKKSSVCWFSLFAV